MTTVHEDHPTGFHFWGGPDDGLEASGAFERRFTMPGEQHPSCAQPNSPGFYERSEVAFHADDKSVCYTVYCWREVPR